MVRQAHHERLLPYAICACSSYLCAIPNPAEPEPNKILEGRPYVAARKTGNRAGLPLLVTILRTMSFISA